MDDKKNTSPEKKAAPAQHDRSTSPNSSSDSSPDAPANVPENGRSASRPANVPAVRPGSPGQETAGRGRKRVAAVGRSARRLADGSSVSPASRQKLDKSKDVVFFTDPKAAPKKQPPIKCATCQKNFATWKALFGHLRSHPEREYRGAFPPPSKEQDEMAASLLNAAQAVQTRMAAEEEPIGSSSQRGLDIDLNEPNVDPESIAEEAGAAAGRGFDLNKPAPEKDDVAGDAATEEKKER